MSMDLRSVNYDVAVRRMVRQQSAKLYNVGSTPIRHSNAGMM